MKRAMTKPRSKAKRRHVLEIIQTGGYHHAFVLSIGATESQILAKINRNQDRSIGHRCSVACFPDDGLRLTPFDHGRVTKGDCRNVVLLLETRTLSRLTFAAIVHESFHIVRNLMDTIGMPLADASEEAWAYAQEDIVVRILRALQR